MNNVLVRYSILNSLLIMVVAICCGSLSAPSSFAETLRDVQSSSAMEKVTAATMRGSRSSSKNKKSQIRENPLAAGMDPRANFTSLWSTGNGPELLFSWIGANLPKYKLSILGTNRSRENLSAQARFLDLNRRRVTLDIILPHPNYYLMMENKTMAQFNRYEPPTLNVLAQEELSFNGLPAMYYRSEKGRCSLLFKIEKKGLVNLSVERCENSNMMMDIAKLLDFTRLNAKLIS